MKPETLNASHATPHFWREMLMVKLIKRDKSTSRDFVARGRPLRGQKRLAPLAKRSTCTKSTIDPVPSTLVSRCDVLLPVLTRLQSRQVKRTPQDSINELIS